MKLTIDKINLCLGDAKFHFDVDITDSITGIFGLSGAGKTTLLKLIAGIEHADSGRMVFNHRVYFDKIEKIDVPPHQRNIGVVFQENFLFPHLNVEKNLRYAEPYTRRRAKTIDFDSVIQLLDIRSLLSKMPSQLSGGERQRAAIGRALLSKPEMLLMDEPFANLDRDRRGRIISYLLEINRLFEIPLIIVSHDLEDMLKLTRSLVIIEHGNVRTAGNYLDLADSGGAPGLISHKRFINIVELKHAQFDEEENLNRFSLDGDPRKTILVTNSQYFSEPNRRRSTVRLAIAPDDIALSKNPIPEISIQNQIKGTICKLRNEPEGCFVSIDCGIEMTAEISRKSKDDLKLEVGKDIYLLIKAKAVEIVHIYGD